MKKWLWVIYPLVVLVVIVVSSQAIFGDPVRWATLVGGRKQVQEEAAKMVAMRAKLAVLEKVNIESATTDLETLVGVVPIAPQVSTWVTSARQAADRSGTIVTKYSGLVTEVKDATGAAVLKADLGVGLTVQVNGTLAQVADMIAELENMKPMLNVVSVKYSPGATILDIEGVWSPIKSFVTVAETPIGDYTNVLRSAVTRSARLQSIEVASDTGEATSLPRTSDPF